MQLERHVDTNEPDPSEKRVISIDDFNDLGICQLPSRLLEASRDMEFVFEAEKVEIQTVDVLGQTSNVYTLTPTNYDKDSKDIVISTGILSDGVMYNKTMARAAKTGQRIKCFDLEHATPTHWTPAEDMIYEAEVATKVVIMAQEEKPGPIELIGHSRGTAITVGAAERLIERGILVASDIEIFLFNPTIANLKTAPIPMAKTGCNILKHVGNDVIKRILFDCAGAVATITRYQMADKDKKNSLREDYHNAVIELSQLVAMAEALKGNTIGDKKMPEDKKSTAQQELETVLGEVSSMPGSSKDAEETEIYKFLKLIDELEIEAGNKKGYATKTLASQALGLLNGMNRGKLKKFNQESDAVKADASALHKVINFLKNVNKSDHEDNYVDRICALAKAGVKVNVLVSDKDTVLPADFDTLEKLSKSGVVIGDVTRELSPDHSGIIMNPDGTDRVLQRARIGTTDSDDSIRLISERKIRETRRPVLSEFGRQLGGLILRQMRQQLNQKLPE